MTSRRSAVQICMFPQNETVCTFADRFFVPGFDLLRFRQRRQRRRPLCRSREKPRKNRAPENGKWICWYDLFVLYLHLQTESGSLAQLVQSVCLTSRGSGVRLPQLPPDRRLSMGRRYFFTRFLRTSAPGNGPPPEVCPVSAKHSIRICAIFAV